MKKNILLVAVLSVLPCVAVSASIDRIGLLERNSPVITEIDTLASLSVGNGAFAFTTDITGLQTFPEYYSTGVPLGTQSQWGWHSFSNPDSLRIEDSYKEYDFGHGHTELYAAEFKEPGRQRDAATWYRVNPHRLHLGCIGLLVPDGTKPEDIVNPKHKLILRDGKIESKFNIGDTGYDVSTVCHPDMDLVAGRIVTSSDTAPVGITLRFAYPTGAHSDDACNWSDSCLHDTEIVDIKSNSAILERTIDGSRYYVILNWSDDKADLTKVGSNSFTLTGVSGALSFSALFSPDRSTTILPTHKDTEERSAAKWHEFWDNGGMVDFSDCPDPRAAELERRVVLSQYLLAIQCAGDVPPQETGLTYNSWFGKHHMEMIWWHQSWLPLYGHPEMLARSLAWYEKVLPKAREIANRQGFKGCRWMKMTDPSGEESPSKVGSFLIWQQPHLIYLVSLLQRAGYNKGELSVFWPMIDETAEFMADFVSKTDNGYMLKGYIPAQETLKAATTYNSPFELSYWYYGLQEANRMREKLGKPRVGEWDKICAGLTKLASDSMGLYLAAESAPETFITLPLISDHPAMLGALGVLPSNPLTDNDKMRNTLAWVMDNWNWAKTWGWDYPMTAMCATRCGQPEVAVEALMKDCQKNTYLPNGHNYQDNRLRCYLPGNGGLLTAIALMCAGSDDIGGANPGFPTSWPVKWEGIMPLP